MPYNITLTNGSDLIAGGLLDNTADSTNTSLTLVGKNYKSYGLFLNQNFVRLMENFANSSAPTAPLPGQIWWNSSSKLLNINISSTKGTTSAIWKTLAGLTYSSSIPTNPYQGELWYDSVNGQLNIYTGTAWRLLGPINKLSTGNSGSIPDVITDAPPSTTYVVIKFFINDTLVGIWSKDGPFATDIPGFATLQKGLNLNSTLGHQFWGTAQAANNLNVNGVPIAGSNFLRNDIAGSINGALSITNDGGITLGAAGDFIGSVSSGVVTLRNQTNNKDLVLSLKTGGVQTPFIKGNAQTGLAEVYSNPTATSPALTVATKNYVDILSGAVNGTANFFGHITPSSNIAFTLGNTTNRWSNVFSDGIVVGNLNANNTFATVSNVASIFLGADILPTATNSSNVGSPGMRFNTLHATAASLTGQLSVGTNATVSGALNVIGASTIGGTLAVTGALSTSATTASTSSTNGALVVAGGVGVGGNLNVGGTIVTATMPAGTANTAVATTAFVQNNAIPSGGLMMWPTVSAPLGWLLCNGAAVSRTTYAALFAVLGTTFGSGDGSTTFNLPNYTNRGPVGAGGLYALGATGGSKDAIVVSHTHTATVNDPGHRHQVGTALTGGATNTGLSSGSGVNTTTATTGISVDISTTGSSGVDANMQPYLAMYFIIKT